MKLHKHPLKYIFAPRWFWNMTCHFVEWRKGNEAFDEWLWAGTPYPAGTGFLYQCLEGITWALGIGSYSTLEDDKHETHI